MRRAAIAGALFALFSTMSLLGAVGIAMMLGSLAGLRAVKAGAFG